MCTNEDRPGRLAKRECGRRKVPYRIFPFVRKPAAGPKAVSGQCLCQGSRRLGRGAPTNKSQDAGARYILDGGSLFRFSNIGRAKTNIADPDTQEEVGDVQMMQSSELRRSLTARDTLVPLDLYRQNSDLKNLVEHNTK